MQRGKGIFMIRESELEIAWSQEVWLGWHYIKKNQSKGYKRKKINKRIKKWNAIFPLHGMNSSVFVKLLIGPPQRVDFYKSSRRS